MSHQSNHYIRRGYGHVDRIPHLVLAELITLDIILSKEIVKYDACNNNFALLRKWETWNAIHHSSPLL